MSSSVSLHRVLVSGAQVLLSGKDAEEYSSRSELRRGFGWCRKLNSKRVSWSFSREFGRCRLPPNVFHVPSGNGTWICRRPSSSLSPHLNACGNARFEMHGLHFLNSGVCSSRRRFRKLLSSSGELSSSIPGSVDGEQDTRVESQELLPFNFEDNDRLESKVVDKGEGDQPGFFASEDVSSRYNSNVTETVSDGGAESSVRPLYGDKTLVGSNVRGLSGVTFPEEASIIQHEKEKSGKLLWNPLRLLNKADRSPAALRKKFADGWHRAETDFFAFSRQLGKYVFIMSGTGAIMVAGLELGGGSPHEQGVLGFSWLAGVVIGSMIGAGQVLKEHARAGRRNVIITGSTRGLGKAIAREFLRHGDNVVITSRNAESVYSTVEDLRKEMLDYSFSLSTADAQMELFGLPSPKRKQPKVIGIPCDVSNSNDVRALAEYAVEEFGSVDLWINNAGVNKGFRPLLDHTGEEIEQIVSTNLIGSLICTREAIKVMRTQKKGGHVFNMDGAGSGGSSTPLTAAYGATKCGLRQLNTSLIQEVKGSRVGIHTASPGMVLTDLLLSGASLQNKKMFNFICEQPETVARALVPNLRLVNGTGKAVNYLTPARIVFAIVSLWIRRGRWFDEQGRALYAAEAERLRLWAEGRERSPVTVAMELVPSGTWVSLFSSSMICAYLILTSASNGNMPGI